MEIDLILPESMPDIYANGRNYFKPKECRRMTEPVTVEELAKHDQLWQYFSKKKELEDLRMFFHYMNEPDFNLICRAITDLCHDRGPMSKMLTDSQYGTLKRNLRPMAHILQEISNPLNTVPYKKGLITGMGHQAKFNVTDQSGGQLATVVAPVIASLLPMAVTAIKKWMSGKDH